MPACDGVLVLAAPQRVPCRRLLRRVQARGLVPTVDAAGAAAAVRARHAGTTAQPRDDALVRSHVLAHCTGSRPASSPTDRRRPSGRSEEAECVGDCARAEHLRAACASRAARAVGRGRRRRARTDPARVRVLLRNWAAAGSCTAMSARQSVPAGRRPSGAHGACASSCSCSTRPAQIMQRLVAIVQLAALFAARLACARERVALPGRDAQRRPAHARCSASASAGSDSAGGETATRRCGG